MKAMVWPLLISGFLGASAHAERYIVKNPHSAILAAQSLKSFELDGDRYHVVEAPRFSALEANLFSGADAVMIDLPIGLPDDRKASWWDVKPKSAWHVKALKYDQLPPERDGRGVVVAVLDTGVDYTHDALKEHMWVNPGEIAANGIDDDGNGFVDDVYGYNIEGHGSDPMDHDEHGTHCAGIIAASADPVTGGQGVAPGAKIMAVRIIGKQRNGFISDAVEGIKYAVDNGANVLSNSWRVYRSWSPYNPSDENIALLRKAIDYAGSRGVLFVAAAGNEARNIDSDKDTMWPGGFEGLSNLVVVGASDTNGRPAYFSNFGSGHVMVAAPGVDIVSTVPGNHWNQMSGTSMASPLVAGSIARGMSYPMDGAHAISKLMDTSAPSDDWKSKARAGGVIQLVDYLR